MSANLSLHGVQSIEAEIRDGTVDEYSEYVWRSILITLEDGFEFRLDLFPRNKNDPSQLTIIDRERPPVTVDTAPIS